MGRTGRVLTLGTMLAALGLLSSTNANAQALGTYSNFWTFETANNRNSDPAPWTFTPNNDPREPGTLAGFDSSGLGHNNTSWNVFANLSDTQWFAAASTPLISPFGFSAHKGYCNIDFFSQMSAGGPSYVMNVWDKTTGTVFTQLGIPWSSSYTEHFYKVEMDNIILNDHNITVQFGFQGTGSLQWMRVDDVSVQCFVFN